MADAVLDSSAALAVLNSEPGAPQVWSYLPGAFMSAVNVAEVATKLIDGGTPAEAADGFVQRLGVEVVSFGRVDAAATARLRDRTKVAGLSLGDRACLALAHLRGLPALTADKLWVALDVGVEVRLIRG